MNTFSGGQVSVVQRLLQLPKGTIDFDEVNNMKKRGYDVAKEEGHLSIVELLANADHGDKQEAMFLTACKEGREDELKQILIEREDIKKSCGAVGFRIACQYGQLAVVNLFLEQPERVIDITAKTREGNNGFIFACRGMLRVLDLLSNLVYK